MHADLDLAQLVSGAGDAIVVVDPKGAITLWNGAAERIFGFTEAEALGRSLDIIIPERLRARHWEGADRTMATGITRYGADLLRVPALHRDGRTLSIAFTVSMLFDAARTVTGVAAFIRDDTKRFQEDRELRKRIAELEQRVAASGGGGTTVA